ncbi:MAG: hypothetical protein H7316_16540 [Tardiphaga sp.]|uniref:hypothetical protein n=1 Tax=Tardiphaga sp. TaxID=1926292 RepID=UPI0019A3381F|nr:hypothetical protein [Tardiphaga sp.]MBC7585353.1 hypothetical protein [Tardiphaga sp.]
MLSRLQDQLQAYRENPDPLAQLANTIALVIAGNQPFYPLYLYAIVGQAAWPSWLTLLTFPLFAVIPAVARRNPLAGRLMLPVVGVANTVLAVKLVGLATAVELFLLPCVLLSTILFRQTEKRAMAAALACPFAAYFMLDAAVGSPLATYSAAEYRSIINMHVFSVASLFALIGFAFPADTKQA